MHRLHELEDELIMKQHRRFEHKAKPNKYYNVRGFKGHDFNTCIYLITSLGGLILVIINEIGKVFNSFCVRPILIANNVSILLFFLVIHAFIITFVIIHIYSNNKKTINDINKWWSEKNANNNKS